jgi:hypothetical protein
MTMTMCGGDEAGTVAGEVVVAGVGTREGYRSGR